MLRINLNSIFGFLILLIIQNSFSQIDVSGFPSGCQNLDQSHFRAVTLIDTMDQPSEIDIAGDGRIFFTERSYGNVGIWDPKLNDHVVAAHFPQVNRQEFGMVSVALDPNFNQTQWVYIWHSPIKDKDSTNINDASGSSRVYLLERFKMNGNLFDKTTRKEILRVPFRQETHNGASMRFGPDGLFYLGSGDNAGARAYGPNVWTANHPHDGGKTTANTNDLRGKILRIQLIYFPDTQNPTPGVGTTYNIPAGNLKEEYASLYNSQELDLIRPEIYTMGHRNVYRINVDVNGWVLFGENGPGATDAGPQGPNGFDEWNVATKPTFFGWPFFNGQNNPLRPWDQSRDQAMTNSNYDALPGAKPRNGFEMNAFYEVNNPVNFSPANTGVIKMPPIKAAIAGQPRGNSQTDNNPFPAGMRRGLGYCTPLGGPVYRYYDYYNVHGNGPAVANPSPIKFPPWFDGKWLIYDDVVGHWMIVEMDSSGNSIDKIYDAPITRGDFPVNRVLDMEFGPDGALYLMNYGGGNEHSGNSNASLVRVEYIGPGGNANTCYLPDATHKNPNYLQEPPTVVESVHKKALFEIERMELINLLVSNSIKVNSGEKLELYNLRGEKIWISTNSSNEDIIISIPKGISKGLVYSKFLRK